jgi:hypothetical protein
MSLRAALHGISSFYTVWTRSGRLVFGDTPLAGVCQTSPSTSTITTDRQQKKIRVLP